VDRAADGTEVIRSVMPGISKWIDWFESSRVMGRYYESYLVHAVRTVHTVYTVYALHIMHNLHAVYGTYYTDCIKHCSTNVG
jgi:hypothetical protein